MLNTVIDLVKIKLGATFSSMMSVMHGKRSSGMTIGKAMIIAVIVIAFLLMMVFSFGLSALLGYQMRVKECEWLFFPLAFISSSVFAFIGSVFAAQSYLFDATDNDLLLSMPIKPSAVLLSRMLTLLLLNAVYSGLILIPVGLSYGIFFHFSVLTFIYYILSLIFIPALVTAFSCVFGHLLGILSSKIPNKNLIIVVFGFIMLAALMLFGLNMGSLISELLNNIDRVAESVKEGFLPLYWYGIATTEGKILYLLPMLLICVVPPILVFMFLSKRFIKIVTRKTSIKKKKYVEKPMKKTNIRFALIKKEVGYFLSIPGYVMNAGFSTIMSILLGVAIIMKGRMISEILPRIFPDASGSLMPLAIGSSLAMCCTMNDVTAPSISLEGKTMWILKSTPIKIMDVFVGKALLAPIVSLPGVIFTAIASALFLPLNSLDILFIIATPVLACLFSGFLGVSINLKLPRLDWAAEITVIKQSLSVIVTLLVAMFFTAIPFTLAIVPAAFLEDFSSLWSYAICVFYFIALTALEIFFLATEGKRIFKEL